MPTVETLGYWRFRTITSLPDRPVLIVLPLQISSVIHSLRKNSLGTAQPIGVHAQMVHGLSHSFRSGTANRPLPKAIVAVPS